MTTQSQYINFARKYRPTNFAEVIGQEVLTTILNHAIINNRLAQGYLLTGIRGVGKTTAARIIAKTLNCSATIIANNNISSCEQCTSCSAFKAQRHSDIIEIDAASKTGVDDIRDIIESSEYRPLVGKYKVFIIDEVHMLSKNAFNALLKVLEEPPLHVIFIFATTEVHKIPLTIISRCQRYDLRRLTFQETLQLLMQIAKKEQIECAQDALKLIAFKSEGSARDAVKLLDQAVNFSINTSRSTISLGVVNQILGAVDTKRIIELFCHIINQDGVGALNLINELYQLAANLENLLADLADFIAYLSKTKILSNYHLPPYTAYRTEIAGIIASINLARLSILWQIFSQGLSELKAAHNQLLAFEMLIIKAIYSHSLPSPEDFAHVGQPANNSHPLRATTLKAATLSSDNQEATAPTINDQSKLQVISKANQEAIEGFLEFLHASKEMAIYYLLLNSVELKKFASGVMEIAGASIDSQLTAQISALLFAWTGKKWRVMFHKQLKIVTLKEKLINQAKSGEDWQIITRYFPSANISDLLLKA